MSSDGPFSYERIALRSANYLENMVDATGLPYFNIFWTVPPEAAHDWPDFGDVMPRQLQAAIMLRRMTGSELGMETLWLKKVQSLLNPHDGCLYRPKTGFSESERHFGDAALTLYTLATAAVDSGNSALAETATRMCDSMYLWKKGGDVGMPVEWAVFAVKSLMICARYLKSESALRLAKQLIDDAFGPGGVYLSDNRFRGHMHGGLRGLVGAADFALYTRDVELFSRVYAFYRDVRDRLATSFGFIPEDTNRKGDVVGCETCALMDYAGLGVTLANHGHSEVWGDMERLARNHLVESQATDCSWLGDSPAGSVDDEQFSWHDIASRASGAWAGWSSPTHILACRETLNAHWGGEELKNKPRAFQNCCGGSGVHALFLLWKNSAAFADGVLKVNMHTDKLLPQAEIRGYQPYEGRLRITLKESCDIEIRIPDFVPADEVRVVFDGEDRFFESNATHVLVKGTRAGDIVDVIYPLEVRAEQVTIGNPGSRMFVYNVTWKGDTVIQMDPHDVGEELVYSDFEKKAVPSFYGESGPGRLYQRKQMASSEVPESLPLHEDDGSLNFWVIGE